MAFLLKGKNRNTLRKYGVGGGDTFKHTSFKNIGFSEITFGGSIEDCSFENCSFRSVKFQNATILNSFFKHNRKFNKVEFIDCKVDKLTFAFLKSNGAKIDGITIIEEQNTETI